MPNASQLGCNWLGAMRRTACLSRLPPSLRRHGHGARISRLSTPSANPEPVVSPATTIWLHSKALEYFAVRSISYGRALRGNTGRFGPCCYLPLLTQLCVSHRLRSIIILHKWVTEPLARLESFRNRSAQDRPEQEAATANAYWSRIWTQAVP